MSAPTTPLVGVTADRRWEEQASLFARRGLATMHGPSMRTLDLAGDERLRTITDEIIANPPDVLVATTGMGMKAWFAVSEQWGRRDELLAALGTAAVVARGAKSSSAVRGAGLDVAWRAPGESMAEVVDHLAGMRPGRVVLQLFDPDGHPSTAAIAALVGELIEVPVYRWLPPVDPAPAHALIRAAVDGSLSAITFTSQPAVHFLFELADGIGLRTALVDACNSGGVLAVCIGPVCAEAGTEEGLTAMVWPEPFRLPPMVRLVADRLLPTPSTFLPTPPAFLRD